MVTLAPVSCPQSAFNTAMWSTGTFEGKQYSCPFFLNVEGLWYRKDLVKTPPTTPAQVLADAQAAMKADPKLKEGIAFEGDQYEGEITSFMVLDKAFGGSLNNLSNINTPQNVDALNYLHSIIYQDKLAPAGVTSYTEGQTGTDFDSGYAAFAINWPYVYSGPFSNGVTAADIGYIPFPANSGGQPGVALGGSVLSINAKTAHLAAVNKLIAFLTSPAQQTARAIAVAGRTRGQRRVRLAAVRQLLAVEDRAGPSRGRSRPAGHAVLPERVRRPAGDDLLGVRELQFERGDQGVHQLRLDGRI